jgi:ATP-dependent Clp protease ATP-binding subunit ClpA
VAQVQIDLRRLPANQQELRGSLVRGYNFTERVRKVLGMAREEAARLHHEYVGTEHILLGLIREGDGVAATMLQNLSVDMDAMERVIDETVKRGNPAQTTGPDLPYTSRAKKVLELAMAEAREVNHSYVGTEHLLLGLLREQMGIAAQVLHDAGVTTEDARAEMLRILGSEVPQESRRTITASGEMSIREARQPLPRFIERLRTVIADAHKVAADRSMTEVTPAHLAIALLEHGEGMANAALDRLGLDRGAAILDLNDLTPLGTATITPETVMGLDADGIAALQAMDAAQVEARAQFAGTQHLLIGLLATSPEVAAVFSAQGITIGDVRDEIRTISG